jgi:succinoglycan biosynthesis transport protein ExoP
MEVSKLLEVLWHRRWIVVITLVATLSVAAIVVSQMPLMYTASATLRISPSGINPLDYTSYLYFDRLAAGYEEISLSEVVVNRVEEELGLAEVPEYEVATISGTDLLEITVTDPDPVLAADTANTVAQILVNQGRELYTSGDREAQASLEQELQTATQRLDQLQESRRDLIAEIPVDQEKLDELDREIEIQQRAYEQLLDSYIQVRTLDVTQANNISIVEPAIIPDEPAGMSKPLQLALSGILGLVGGVALALTMEYFRPKIHTREEIEELVDAPIIGSVRVLRRSRLRQPTTGEMPHNSFRRLQTNLLMLADNSNDHTVLITSPAPNDGKTVVTANLAHSLAVAGYSTVVIDADLRRPSMHKAFGMDNEFGLSDVLRGTLSPYDAVQRTEVPKLVVLTAGQCPEDPTLLVTSNRMKAVLDELAAYYNFVLIDTPAFLGVPEAATIARMAEQTLLVTRHTPDRRDLEETVEALRLIDANIIGIVLNRVPSDGTMRYRRYYSTPTPPQQEMPQSANPSTEDFEDYLAT